MHYIRWAGVHIFIVLLRLVNMLKPAFNIVAIDGDPDELISCILLMEVGEKMFSYVLLNKEKNRFFAVRHYNLDVSHEKTTTEILNEIIKDDKLLQQPVKEIIVVYNFPDASLLPETFFNTAISKPLTELMHGDVHRGLVLSERVQGFSMTNVYRIPREIHSLLQQKFAAGKYWHYYTMMLLSVKNYDVREGAFLKTIFYADQIIVAVLINGQLQLLQSYNYHTPEDVAYYLLKICQQLNIDQEELLLQLSGLIDTNSALYTELQKYFQQIVCEEAPEHTTLNGLADQYPAHYFSPLMKMVLCVS